jgi:hypothetical protein
MYIRIQAFKYRPPKHVIDKIHYKDRKNLTAYVIAQEGESTPTDLDRGFNPLKWGKGVIQALAGKMKGLNFFSGHGKGTNSHAGRASIGRVVASYVENIGGKLSNVIIGAFDSPPKEDVVSMEAEINFNESTNEVESITKVTGIAAALSRDETPAFSGAVKLATIQCFENKTNQKERVNTMPDIQFQDILDFMRERAVFPSQVGFEDVKSIKKDNVLWPQVKDYFKSEFEAEKQELQDKLDTANKELSVFKTEKSRKSGRKILEDIVKDNTTDKMKDWVMTRFDEKKPTDFTREGLEKFVEDEKTSFATYQEKFGASDTKPAPEVPDDKEEKDLANEVIEGILNEKEG